MISWQITFLYIAVLVPSLSRAHDTTEAPDSWFTSLAGLLKNEGRQLQAPLPPGTVTDECKTDNSKLYSLMGVIQEAQNIETWKAEYNGTVCEKQTREQTTCMTNFTAFEHNLESVCANVGGIYATSSFTFQCDIAGDTMFYNGRDVPTCDALSCGVDAAKTLLEEAVEALHIEWISYGYTCETKYVNYENAIIPDEVVVQNCPDATVSLRETSTELATVIDTRLSYLSSFEEGCLVSDGAVECALDFATLQNITQQECNNGDGFYFEADYSLTCSNDDGASLTLTGVGDPMCVALNFCTSEDLDEQAMIATQPLPELLQAAGWKTCEYTNVRINDFLPTEAPTISPAPTAGPVPTISPAPSAAATCLDDSIQINYTEPVYDELVAIQAKIDETPFGNYCLFPEDVLAVPYVVACDIDYAEHPNTLKDVCAGEEGAVYVESTFTVGCVGETSETKITYLNKPGCRASKCNGGELKEVAAYEYEWIRAAMEEMNEGQTCTTGEISVLVGGNMEGDGPVVLTEECRGESDQLDSTIAIFNEKQISRNDFLAYIATELRLICATKPNTVICTIDAIEEGFLNNIEPVCHSNEGQYLETTFQIDCVKEEEVLIMKALNIPSCVGRSCSPGQSKLYLPGDQSWLGDHYANLEGWECNTTILDVYAPNYRPDGNYEDIIVLDDTTTDSTPTPQPNEEEPADGEETEEEKGINDEIVQGEFEDTTAEGADATAVDGDALGHGTLFNPSPKPSTRPPTAAPSIAPTVIVEESSSFSITAIVGIVVGILLICLGLCILCAVLRRRREAAEMEEDSENGKRSHDGTVDAFADEMDNDNNNMVIEYDDSSSEEDDEIEDSASCSIVEDYDNNTDYESPSESDLDDDSAKASEQDDSSDGSLGSQGSYDLENPPRKSNSNLSANLC